jgi:hypothetical protein
LRGGKSKPIAHANSRTSSTCDAMAFALLVMIHAGPTFAISGSRPRDYPSRRILSRVRCIASFAD